MKENIYGFKIKEITEVPEIDATLYEYQHECGARLIYSKREDDNKTFAIAFPTIPTDDTGVFHILEHSVLCGSEKYPVKDPFSELLKSSLKTFMNAFTYTDKTVYPASSRCERDFLNLIDVYMDAVLHPLVLRDKRIFMQEGVHFEYDEEGNLTPGGVVYSEMQGAYSSPDELGVAELMRLIYPDGTYGFDSGGRPDSIPHLTHKALVRAHAEFYHPSNAYIFLDGCMDLDLVLSHIDKALSGYEKRETAARVSIGSPLNTEPRTVEYAIAPGEGPERRARVLIGFRGVGFDNKLDIVALSVITSALASGNDAPLRKKILDTGICESLLFFTRDEAMENSVIAEMRGVNPEDTDLAEEIFFGVLREIISDGIPKELIDAELSVFEFAVKERDFGSYPKGLAYATSAMDSWLYGGAADLYLSYNDLLAHLRKLNETDYFSRLIERITDAPRARLSLIPSDTVAERECARLCEWLASVDEGMSEEERDGIIKDAEQLLEWQSQPDSEEALATVPYITVDDAPKKPRKIPTEVTELGGVRVLAHPIHTGGIVYTDMLFDISDIAEADLYKLTLITMAFTEVGTSRGSSADLRARIKKAMGSFAVTTWLTVRDGETKLYLVARASMLRERISEAVEIIKEVLYTSDFGDTEALRRRFIQFRRRLEESIHTGSHTLASVRCGARYSTHGAVVEKLTGISAYESMKSYDADPDGFIAELSRFMGDTCDKYFRRGRMTLGITANAEDLNPENEAPFIDAVKEGGIQPGGIKAELLPMKNEGFQTTASVGYTVYFGKLPEEDHPFPTGGMAVASAILDYELLWNEIRVKGGAYGTGFIHRPPTASVGMYSYRDPSPDKTATVAPKMGDMLREFAGASPSIDKYLIGTLGDIDRLSSPSQDGFGATAAYLSGRSYEDMERERNEILSFNTEKLLDIARDIDIASENATLTVMASRDTLLGMGDALDEIIAI